MEEADKRRYYWNGFWVGIGLGMAIGSTIIQLSSARAQTGLTCIDLQHDPDPAKHCVTANGVDWSNGYCYAGGIYFPARPFGQCESADRYAYSQTMPPAGLPSISSGTVVSTVTSSSSRTCPNDRSMVMVGAGSYKCAKDLTDPE